MVAYPPKKKAAKPATLALNLKRYGRKERKQKMASIVRALGLAAGKSGKLNLPVHAMKRHRIAKFSMAIPNRKKYAAGYRDLWDAQDEFVRTSLVTDLVEGFASSGMSATDLGVIKGALAQVSAYRFPTRWSGFNFNDGSKIAGHSAMQHPTSKGQGIFVPTVHGFSKPHTDLDEGRAAAVIDALHEFITVSGGKTSLKAGATLDAMVKAMIIEAGTFTMNNFTAPAMASNIATTATPSNRKAQTSAREFVKDQLIALGATRRASAGGASDERESREWRTGGARRSVSPRRTKAVSEADADKHWQRSV